jgi:predicted ATPase
MTLAPGTRLGPYEIVSPIGKGGMGEVFLALDTRLDRSVALKILPADIARDDDDRVRRFTLEARAASALSHPNVATIFDVGESGGTPYIAMEHVDGRTLADAIAAGRLTVGEVIAIATQIADALAAAHARGIIHRDIKPGNLMITPAGQVKVLDFGLAKSSRHAAGGGDPTRLAITSPGIVVGTVAYMSPEQAIGEPLDERSDLFSVGVVLYEALTGRAPFLGGNDLQTVEKIRHSSPDAIGRFNRDVPAELDRIVRKCLEKARALRYQSARDLLADLRSLARESGPAVVAAPSEPSLDNLPEQLTSFVGRRREIEEVANLIASNRLLTLTGSGGSGKTRLALRVAGDLRRGFRDGVWLVDLAPVSDPDVVAQSIASVLKVAEGGGKSIRDAILDRVRQLDLLLIMDNCEQVIDATAALVETLLRASPGLRVLATSREALGVAGENVWRVPSLTLPASTATIDAGAAREFEAVRLFEERASALSPFALSDANVAAVAEICRRLDGIPLAIELAAARTPVLSVDQIKSRLEDRFRLLTGGSRTALARQRTLEATVAWSYDLLTDRERHLVDRLAVFAGGWTLDAAEAVCEDGEIARDDVVDLLARLVDKSLAVVEDDGRGERRYRFLETIKHYAKERLIESGGLTAIARRHFDYFRALAVRAEPELSGSDQVRWLDRLDVEHGNIRAALHRASSGDLGPEYRGQVLTMTASPWWFWAKRGYFSEGRQRLETAIAEAARGEARIEARALVGLLHMVAFQGDLRAMRDIVARSLVSARAAGDTWAEAYTLGFESILESEVGNFPRAAAAASEACAVARGSSDPQAHSPLALALRMLGYMALQQGNLQEAGGQFAEAIAIQRQAGEKWSLGILLSDLAALRAVEGQFAEAKILGREAIGLCQELGDRRGVAWCLQTLAMVAAAEGSAKLAAKLSGAADGLLAAVGATGQITVTRVQDRFLSTASAALGDDAFRAAAASGRAMPWPQAVQLATHP